MQNAWERSVAATARSGEDVHFWSSLALTSASTAQQLTSLLMVDRRRVPDPRRQALGRRAGRRRPCCPGRVLAPIAGIAAVITRATQTFIALKAINRVMALERERPPERTYVARRVEKGRIAFENVTFSYPNVATRCARQGLVPSRPPASGSESSAASARARRPSAAC